MPKRAATWEETVEEAAGLVLRALPDMTRNQGRCTSTVHLKRLLHRRGLDGYLPSALRRLEREREVRVAWEPDGISGVVFYEEVRNGSAGEGGAEGQGATDGPVASGGEGLEGDGEEGV